MTDRRDELIQLTNDFVDAFNRMNLDDVVRFLPKTAFMRIQPAAGISGTMQFEQPLNPWWGLTRQHPLRR